MGVLENLISKFAVQTAVYWGTPQSDGMGGFTWSAPIEVNVRWDDKSQLVINKDGKEVQSDAEILTNAELVYNGWLVLSDLETLNGAYSDISNPRNIEGARQIMAKDKIPFVKSTDDFLRKYYLGG